MDVTSLSSTTPVNTAATAANQKPAETTATATETKKKPDVAYEASGQAYKPDTKKVKTMLAQQDMKTENFRKLVEGLLDKQAQKSGAAGGFYIGKNDKNPWKGTQWENDLMVAVDETTRAN
ncbi:MAG: hypothetical protein LBU77_07305, partial [Clostridiales bacterium]|nr:hypothetical protein [Clostridiales bacterium]